MTEENKINTIANVVAVAQEVGRAQSLFPKFNSAHEGLAVMWEEFDELKEEVFKKNPDMDKLYTEAKQCAAMAIRFMNDVCSSYHEADADVNVKSKDGIEVPNGKESFADGLSRDDKKRFEHNQRKWDEAIEELKAYLQEGNSDSYDIDEEFSDDDEYEETIYEEEDDVESCPCCDSCNCVCKSEIGTRKTHTPPPPPVRLKESTGKPYSAKEIRSMDKKDRSRILREHAILASAEMKNERAILKAIEKNRQKQKDDALLDSLFFYVPLVREMEKHDFTEQEIKSLASCLESSYKNIRVEGRPPATYNEYIRCLVIGFMSGISLPVEQNVEKKFFHFLNGHYMNLRKIEECYNS